MSNTTRVLPAKEWLRDSTASPADHDAKVQEEVTEPKVRKTLFEDIRGVLSYALETEFIVDDLAGIINSGLSCNARVDGVASNSKDDKNLTASELLGRVVDSLASIRATAKSIEESIG